MTIKEALLDTVSFDIPVGRIDKALIDADLNGAAVYTKADEKAVDLCAAGLLLTTIRNKRVSEDDVTIEGPELSLLKMAYSALMRKWGLPDPFAAEKPTVKQISYY